MADKQPTLGSLVSGITEDLSGLVRGEIELAKTELKQTVQTASAGGGMLAGAALFGFLALVFLLLTLAWVLVQLGLPYWAGFGIVTLLLILITVILGLVGKKKLEATQGAMTRTQASIEETKAAFARKPAALAEAPAPAPGAPASPASASPSAPAARPAAASPAAAPAAPATPPASKPPAA